MIIMNNDSNNLFPSNSSEGRKKAILKRRLELIKEEIEIKEKMTRPDYYNEGESYSIKAIEREIDELNLKKIKITNILLNLDVIEIDYKEDHDNSHIPTPKPQAYCMAYDDRPRGCDK